MNEELGRWMARHFVSLGWNNSGPGVQHTAGNASAVLMSVAGAWYLVTAGHWFTELRAARLTGQSHDQWVIDDSPSAPGYDETPYAIPIAGEEIASAINLYSEDFPSDYGIVPLRRHHRRLLEARGKVAVDEGSWMAPDDLTRYWLMGVPTRTLREGTQPGRVCKNVELLDLERIDEPPASLHSPFPRFYARIRSPSDSVPSIEGMSGGPVFGFKEVADGLRCWVVALQSGWLERSRVIAACPLKPLGLWLGEIARGQTRPE